MVQILHIKKDVAGFELIAGVLFGLLLSALIYFNFESLPFLSLIDLPRNLVIFLMVILLLIYRMKVDRFGLLIFSAGMFFVFLLLFSLLFRSAQLDILSFEQLVILIVLILLPALTIDVLFNITEIPSIDIENFSLHEFLGIAFFAFLDFLLVYSYPLVSIEEISTVLVMAGIAILNLLARFILDAFGTITLTFLFLSIFTALNQTFGKTDILFGNLTGFQVIICGLVVGLMTDISISLFSRKNIFKLIQEGADPIHLESTYSENSNFYFIATIYGIVAPTTLLLLSEHLVFNEVFFLRIISRMFFSILGGICIAIFYQDIYDSIIVYIFRPVGFMQTEAIQFEKWISSCAIADIDKDGKTEVLVGCANYNLYCLKESKEVFKIPAGNIISFCLVDTIGKSSENRIFFGSYDGTARCFDSTGKELWRVSVGKWVWCGSVGDFDNDGENEFIIGCFDDSLRCIKDGGEEIWSVYFESFLGCCCIGDVNNDGIQELFAGSNDGTFRCFQKGVEVWRTLFNDWVTSCAIGDVNNDGIIETLAASTDGTLRCYQEDREIWRRNIIGTVGALEIADIDNDGENELLLGCGDGTLRCIKNHREIWVKEFNRYPDCVAVGDLDGDGILEFISGDWDGYLRSFKTPRKFFR